MRIISGKARGRSIDTPGGMDTRPTLDRVRENLFNILQNCVYGSDVLDLFAGSGALALEAVSRGAESAVLCDCAGEAHRIEKSNVEKLGFQDACRLLRCDWHQAVDRLKAEGAAFDLVFLDPPYRMHDLTEVTGRVCELLKIGGRVIVEYDAHSGLPAVCDLLEMVDQRKYGIAGIGIFQMKGDKHDA